MFLSEIRITHASMRTDTFGDWNRNPLDMSDAIFTHSGKSPGFASLRKEIISSGDISFAGEFRVSSLKTSRFVMTPVILITTHIHAYTHSRRYRKGDIAS